MMGAALRVKDAALLAKEEELDGMRILSVRSLYTSILTLLACAACPCAACPCASCPCAASILMLLAHEIDARREAFSMRCQLSCSSYRHILKLS